MRWMNLESIIEWSQSEKQMSINIYIWNLKRQYWWTYWEESSGDADVEKRLTDVGRQGQGSRGWDEWREEHETSTLACVKQSQWESAAWLRELNGLGNNPEGWAGLWEGHSRGKGRVYLWLIHVDVWQKPTQDCKAIILQLKFFNNRYK